MTATKEELRNKAVAGEEIPEELVTELRQEETPEGAVQPPRGGVAGMSLPPSHQLSIVGLTIPSSAMAQSLHDKQENLKHVVEEVTSKPEEELTQEDASKVMSAEVSRSPILSDTTSSPLSNQCWSTVPCHGRHPSSSGLDLGSHPVCRRP